MKKILWVAIVAQFALSLWADDIALLEQKASQGDATSAYALAQHYEALNNKECAYEWYKKASMLALEKKTSKPLENTLLHEKVAKVERTQEVYGSVLTPYADDPQTFSSAQQMITKTFDLSTYKSNYLLPFTFNNQDYSDERQHFETKFQISFQKNLADNLLGLDDTLSLGYTQTSWWQTGEKSTPFRESNYQPELFMMMPHFNKESIIKAYQFGLLHESNGQGLPKSRSWNRLYAKTYLQLDGLIVSPRIWYRIPEEAIDDDNPDIDDYLGYGDIEFIYPWKKHTLHILARHNLHSNESRGAIQVDWTFPLWEESLFGYIQLFSGYGESLIDYNKRSDRIGIGFALSR